MSTIPLRDKAKTPGIVPRHKSIHLVATHRNSVPNALSSSLFHQNSKPYDCEHLTTLGLIKVQHREPRYNGIIRSLLQMRANLHIIRANVGDVLQKRRGSHAALCQLLGCLTQILLELDSQDFASILARQVSIRTFLAGAVATLAHRIPCRSTEPRTDVDHVLAVGCRHE